MRATAVRAASTSSSGAAAVKQLRVEPAQHQVGVGDGRAVAAAAVAGGPRLGARRSRADVEGAAGIAPCDRAAAGADDVQVDDRKLTGSPWKLPSVVTCDVAVLDQPDVEAGAAHVDRDDAVAAVLAAVPGRGDDAAGRTGIYGRHRTVARIFDRRRAAVGLDDEELARLSKHRRFAA